MNCELSQCERKTVKKEAAIVNTSDISGEDDAAKLTQSDFDRASFLIDSRQISKPEWQRAVFTYCVGKGVETTFTTSAGNTLTGSDEGVFISPGVKNALS